MVRRSHIVLSLLAALALAAPVFAADSYQPGSTLLVSRDSGLGALPAQSDGRSDSGPNAVSANGRFTVFSSEANDLGAADIYRHVYVRDDQDGSVTLLDRAGPGGPVGNGWVYDAAISRDGSRVCFATSADNLVPGVGPGHLYVASVATGSIVAADRATGGTLANGRPDNCVLSGDGGVVAFDSFATNLGVASGTHVYARTLGADTTQLVDSYNGAAGNSGASRPSISANGEIVAFESDATNLAPGVDTNGKTDVYVRGLKSATPVLASRADGGGAVGDGPSHEASLSDDGLAVAFTSTATNLGDGDNDSTEDVHLARLLAGTVTLVSRGDGAGGAKGNRDSFGPAIAGDGSAVAFLSEATNIGGTPGPASEGHKHLAYLRALAANHTALVNRASGAGGTVTDESPGTVALDQHAGHAVWTDSAAGLDPLGNGIFSEVYERELSGAFQTKLVSRPQDPAGRPGAVGAIDTDDRAISAEGRFVVFSAQLAADGASADVPQVFVRDVLLGTTRLVSRAGGADGATANADSGHEQISADGTKVVFVSDATNLTPDGTVPGQAYVRDLVANTTTLVSVGASGPAADGVNQVAIDQDGGKVAFSTWSPMVPGDTNNAVDIFVRDMGSGGITDASLTSTGAQLDAGSEEPAISSDGTRVGFMSPASNTAEGASPGDHHAYVRDLVAGTTLLVDRKADGSPSDRSVYGMTMSADGNRFTLETPAKLTPEALDGIADVFVRDVAAGTTVMASTAPGGGEANDQAFLSNISLDGTRVAFFSRAKNLPAGDQPNGGLYERDLRDGSLVLLSARDGSGVPGDDGGEEPSLNADGSCAVFDANDSSLGSPSYAGHDVHQIWMHVVAGECPVYAPDTTITSGPDGNAKVRQAYSVFGYQADESGATFTCSLDDAPMKPCGDAFHTGALRDGVHRFKVAATDRARNTDPTPALVTFTVGVPPRVTKLHMDKRGRLVFKLSERAKVRVRLTRVGRAHSAAVGKLTIERSFKKGTRRVKVPMRRLRSGHYHATVVATDGGGNRSVPKHKRFVVRH